MKSKYVRIFTMMILIFHFTKMHTNSRVPLYFFEYAFSSITFKILNLHNKNTNIFAVHIFCLKCCRYPDMPCKSCPGRHLRNNFPISHSSHYTFKYEFSSITLKILNLHNKNTNTFAFHIFCLKCCRYPDMPC